MALNDSFFNKVENKTNVDKKTILDLANKLDQNGRSREAILEIIDTLSKMTGKKVSNETKNKILSKIESNDVPKDLDTYF